jgi:SAM-dependent methyltransferase
VALRTRVGCLPPGFDDDAGYLEKGRAGRRAIERLLPPDWTWPGKRVLDFGCGAGRTLRHFVPEAPDAELWGADIDRDSIEWARAHLSPPCTLVRNDESPPLPVADDTFDLIYAISVFSHLTTQWAAWLVELHRLLRPDGILIATFMGEGMSLGVAGEAWDDQRVGMSVHSAGQSWDLGGPMVLLSPWWIREHWGRLFEIDALITRNFLGGAPVAGQHDHGAVVARKTDRHATVDELERINASEPREAIALYHETRRLRGEVGDLRLALDGTARSPTPTPRDAGPAHPPRRDAPSGPIRRALGDLARWLRLRHA